MSPAIEHPPRCLLLATLDTKGAEAAYVREQLIAAGIEVTLIDCGCLGEWVGAADVSRESVMAAGGGQLAELAARGDRGAAIRTAAAGAAKLVREAYDRGEADGVLALGGSAGTTIGTSAMRALPIGVPKLMVSTLASGDCRPYVGDKDILMHNSVVDIAGVNRISRAVLGNAAAAMAGMLRGRAAHLDDEPDSPRDRPLIAATMFGVTTPCVQHARALLEAAGYEVLVFHATGNGGQAMETLIDDGLIAGVLDITTTELADELVGGVLSAGPDRLTAAARRGVPQVVSVGAVDMVNFGPRHSVPDRFADRTLYQHNDTVTLMRTTPAECAAIGREIAAKVGAACERAAILLPLNGVSAIDKEGQPFNDESARRELFAAIRSELESRGATELVELPWHINDPEFAEAAANKLLELLGKPSTMK
ncbi:MAG: Tm-1-like ATP-binding domain-containing protein [Planctomycetales bacterium]|nr:Tm-1-like ATP-binding domain-containing protein [Planctomycetales bacterium]